MSLENTNKLSYTEWEGEMINPTKAEFFESPTHFDVAFGHCNNCGHQFKHFSVKTGSVCPHCEVNACVSHYEEVL